MPAQAGIHRHRQMDSRLRGKDKPITQLIYIGSKNALGGAISLL